MGDDVKSVTELADRLYKAFANRESVIDRYYALALSRVCANAADAMLPLSVVEQLLKGTNYEQLI